MPLFGGKHKTPHELVEIVRNGLYILSSPDVKDEKKVQKVTLLFIVIIIIIIIVKQTLEGIT